MFATRLVTLGLETGFWCAALTGPNVRVLPFLPRLLSARIIGVSSAHGLMLSVRAQKAKENGMCVRH